MIAHLTARTAYSRRLPASSIDVVSTELTRRRAVDLLRVATMLCPAA